MKIDALLRIWVLAWSVATLLAPSHTNAQTWPAKPLRIVIPFSAGAGADVLTRFIVDRLAFHLNTQVFIENREGAGGIIGSQAVLRSPADGYTLLGVPSAFLIAPHLRKDMPYDPVRDFVPVAKAASVPLVVVVGGQSQFRTMKDLLDYMRAHPRAVHYATQGKGTQAHLEIEYFSRMLGIEAVDVPYKLYPTALADTMSNVVAFQMVAYSVVASNVSAGKLRALAIGALSRLPAAPAVPTFAEATGIPNYAPAAWLGYFVAAGTPAEIVAKLEQGILRTMAEPAIGEQVSKSYNNVDVLPSREFGAQVRAEFEKIGKLVKELKLGAD